MRTQVYPLITMSIEEDEDIVFVEYRHNLEVTLIYAKEIVLNRLEFTNHKAHYLVLDFSNVKSVSHEAKNYLLDPDSGTKNILGAAFIAGNPVSALIANIFIKPSKGFPSKFFSKKKDAVNWLKEVRGK